MIYTHTGFMTCSAAAKALDMTRQGLMKAVMSNRIDGYKCNGIWLFKKSDVIIFMNSKLGAI